MADSDFERSQLCTYVVIVSKPKNVIAIVAIVQLLFKQSPKDFIITNDLRLINITIPSQSFPITMRMLFGCGCRMIILFISHLHHHHTHTHPDRQHRSSRSSQCYGCIIIVSMFFLSCSVYITLALLQMQKKVARNQSVIVVVC